MLKAIRNHFAKKNLREPRYLPMFDPYHSDEGDEYVSFDCETTGLDIAKDEIISIGAVKIKNNTILTSESLELYIKPEGKINRKSIEIHHLRECDLDRGVSQQSAIIDFLDFIGNRPLIGYYLEFDIAMVNKVTQPLFGLKLPNTQHEISAIYHDKKIELIPQGHIDLRFDTIMQDLDLPSLGKHGALNDAIMCAMMFIKLNQTKSLRRIHHE